MKKNRNAFTMIELVFVIVILGILSAIAIPKLAATRADAHITKGKADVASIRSSIVTERQSRLFRGQSMYISALDSGVAANTAGVTIFDNNGTAANIILQYGVTTGLTDGHWFKSGANQYTFRMMSGNNNAVFTYTQATGIFDCAGGAGTMCARLTD